MSIRDEEAVECFECHNGEFVVPDGQHMKCDSCGAAVAKKLLFDSQYVKEDTSEKPDPDEPFRYVCPDCKTQVRGRYSKNKYECNSCEKHFAKEELLDKKKKQSFDDPREAELFTTGSEELLESIIDYCEKTNSNHFKTANLECVEDAKKWTNAIGELRDKGIIKKWGTAGGASTWIYQG